MAQDQPTLTDGVITLRAWRDEDVEPAAAGHDDEMALWLGGDATDVSSDRLRERVRQWREEFAADRRRSSFVVEHESRVVGSVEVTVGQQRTGELRWTLYAGHRGRGFASRAVRVLVDWAFAETAAGGLGLQRVEARIDPRNDAGRRVATRAGLRLEGTQRIVPGSGDRADATAAMVYARLVSDPPLSDPVSFRALLNSFLPRKRAIAQMVLRDPDGRVLLCQLTYKRDWDLPGGVVEVGENPKEAVAREVEEELGLEVSPGELLLTDWMPPWGGWDDAVCLVFDGGVLPGSAVDRIVRQEREIKDAQFLTLDEIEARAADFTTRRIRSALDPGTSWTESGR